MKKFNKKLSTYHNILYIWVLILKTNTMATKNENLKDNFNATIGNTVLNEESFSVYSYSMIDMNNADKWVHWSKGLKVIIQKNGVEIKLEEDEIMQLIKCLPRTFGGSY